MHRTRRNTLSLTGVCLGTLLLVVLSTSLGCERIALPAPEAPLSLDKPPAAAASSLKTVVFDSISLSYDSGLASGVETEAIAAVPLNPDWLHADTYPSYVRFRFEGYEKGEGSWLPYPFSLSGPQVMVYQTEEFAAFGDDPTGFSRQLQALRALLEDRPDLSVYVAEAMDRGPQDTPYLPFLPWLNSSQAFCAQTAYIEFDGGAGIRYLTAFLQEAAISDSQVFYTFQGVTDDGRYYFAAVLPLATEVFAEEGGAELGPIGPEEWKAFLAQGVRGLNAQPGDGFVPTLATLDEIVASIRIGA
jgi:hypothetical protein